jgi:hypothetical protein
MGAEKQSESGPNLGSTGQKDRLSPTPPQQGPALIPNSPPWQIGRQLWLDREYAKAVRFFEEVEKLRPLTCNEAHY